MTFLEILECIGLLGGAGLAGYAFGYCEKKLNEMKWSKLKVAFSLNEMKRDVN